MSYTYLKNNSEKCTSSLEQGEESSAECFADIPQYVLWRLNLIPSKSCSKDSETESCQSSQSGQIVSQNSTENHGGDQLRFWPGDFLVKTYLSREQTTEKHKGLKESGQAYGRSIKELLARCGLNLCLPKIPRTFALRALSPSSKICGSWGMTRDGVSLEVATLVRITEERESGYLPTPMATDWKGGTVAIRKDTGKQRLDQWRDYVKVKHGMTYPHPTHSELRMGWPEKWTDSAPLAMDKFQLWLGLHGQS